MSRSNGLRKVNKVDGGKGIAKKLMTLSRRADSKKIIRGELDQYGRPYRTKAEVLKMIADKSAICTKCKEPMQGRGFTYADPEEGTPENHYVFCGNIQSGCYSGW